MNVGELTGLGILWMVAAGITSGCAEKNGWGQGKWYLASLATGPVAWFVLYLKLRDKREKIGPLNRRSQFHQRSSPGNHSRRGTQHPSSRAPLP